MQIGGHLVWQQDVIDVDCLTNSHIITVVLVYIKFGDGVKIAKLPN